MAPLPLTRSEQLTHLMSPHSLSFLIIGYVFPGMLLMIHIRGFEGIFFKRKETFINLIRSFLLCLVGEIWSVWSCHECSQAQHALMTGGENLLSNVLHLSVAIESSVLRGIQRPSPSLVGKDTMIDLCLTRTEKHKNYLTASLS